VFIEEAGADEVADLWDGSDQVFCVTVGYLEIRGVIARRLAAPAARRARAELDEDWEEVEPIDVDETLIDRAAGVVEAHRLRTFDALHLAAALDLRDAELVVATWDRQLAAAARTEGLAVAPTG
jgi:hypothetical protein